MIFTKRIIRTTSIPKIWKIRRSIWKIKAKKWPNFGHKWPNFGHLRIFSAYTIRFSKKDHKVVSIRKIMKVYSGVGRYRPKTLKNGLFGQIWPNFDHFWPFWGFKSFRTKIIGGHMTKLD